MNAKNLLRLIEKHAGDARQCYPSDAEMRCWYFALALGKELDRSGEPIGKEIEALTRHETNTPAPKGVMP